MCAKCYLLNGLPCHIVPGTVSTVTLTPVPAVEQHLVPVTGPGSLPSPCFLSSCLVPLVPVPMVEIEQFTVLFVVVALVSLV